MSHLAPASDHRTRERCRELGLSVLQAIEAHCRTDATFAALRTTGGLRRGSTRQADSLESFFFAETLKYLYLLLADTDRNSDEERPGLLHGALLDVRSQHVLTTEAHILPMLAAAPRASRTSHSQGVGQQAAPGDQPDQREGAHGGDGAIPPLEDPLAEGGDGRAKDDAAMEVGNARYPPWWGSDDDTSLRSSLHEH